MTDRPLRVAFVGTYDRTPHGRNAIVIEALRSAGIEVVEHHVPLWGGTADKLAAAEGGAAHLGRVALRAVKAWRELDRLAQHAERADVVWVGATGLLDLPIARRIAVRWGAPLVFDPLVSLGETVRDRGLAAPGGKRLRVFDGLERALFRLPDLVVVDTAAHVTAWAAEIGLAPRRSLVLPVGAPRVFHDRVSAYAPTPGRPLSVVYFGQFIPLHGVEIMLRAAHGLREADIDFTFVGVGQTCAAAQDMARGLGLTRVRFEETWLTPSALIDAHVTAADVCLGAFGDRPKTARVVPYKVYAALAAGRVVVTGDTPALRERLTPGHDVMAVPCGDPHALAQALTDLAADPARRSRMAAAGRIAWEAQFSPEHLGRELRSALFDTAAVHRAERRGVGPRHRWRVAHLVHLARPENRGVGPDAPAILDVGCGDGATALAIWADQSGAKGPILAFDRDKARVDAAGARARRDGAADRVHVFVADAHAIPLESGSVQRAVSGEVLEHVADDAAAAREIARVLALNGALALTVPAGAARFGPADRAAGHRRRYDAGDLERLLQEAGLTVERLSGWGFPFGRLYDRWVQRPALAAVRRESASRESDAEGGAARRAAVRAAAMRALGGLPVVDRLWQALFALDTRLSPRLSRRRTRRRALGSGWDALARKGP